MLLLNPGQASDAPLPKSQPSALSKTEFSWLNLKDDGKSYGISDLLEDALKPLQDKLSDYQTIKGLRMDGLRMGMQKAIDELKATVPGTPLEDQWMDSWSKSFQLDPSRDTSELISADIKQLLGDKDSTGTLADSYNLDTNEDVQKKIVDDIKSEMSKFMPTLETVTPLINRQALMDEMNKIIDNELGKLNLDRTDEGLDKVLALEEESLDSIEKEFSTNAVLKTTTDNRPYRIFNQAKAKEEAEENFVRKFHTQDIADSITTALFKKAWKGKSFKNGKGETIESLHDILNPLTPTGAVIDSRLIDALGKIEDLLKNTKPDATPIPVEVFNKLLGTSGDKFQAWYKTWKNLIQTSHVESFKAGATTGKVTFNLELRDGIKVIDQEIKNGITYPPFNSDTTRTPLKCSESTPTLNVQSVSYITKLFQDEYKKMVLPLDIQKGTINEDNLELLLGTPPYASRVKEGITPEQIAKLDPNAYSKLAALIEDCENTIIANLKTIYPSFNYDKSKVKVTFKIEYTDVDGDKELSIVPKIVDENVEDLPGVDWTGTTTDLTIQTQINKIFNDNDKKNEALDYGSFAHLNQKVVSALDNAVSELYKIFQKDRQYNGVQPFKMDIVKALAEKDEIPQSYFEDVFKGLKADLDKFNLDNHNRFKVEYTIKELTEKRVVISYKVTDTHLASKPYEVKTMDGDDLDNIAIDFNESLDKAQYWLERLQKEKVDKSDFATHSAVEALGKRKPLELKASELQKAFSKFDELKDKALNDPKNGGVILTIGKLIERDKFKDGDDTNTDPKNIEKEYYQQFEASFADPSIKTHHEIEIKISHNFVSQEEIDDLTKKLTDNHDSAKDIVEKSLATDDQKNIGTKAIEGLTAALQAQVAAAGADMSEDKLKDIEDKSDAMKASAEAAAKAAAKASILKQLQDANPNGVPKEMMELFEQKWPAVAKAIEADPSLLHDLLRLKKLLNRMNANIIMSAQRKMEQSGKIGLLALGSILGMGAFLGGANSVKVATTNKKAVSARTGKIKSSKKLAILSALIGLASAGGSIATLLYLFLAQGGL